VASGVAGMTAEQPIEDELIELLAHAFRTVCGESDERLASLRAALHGRSPDGPGSRQGRHARSGRALTSALAALTVLGLEDEAFEHVFSHPGFARLHPNCADVHVRIGELLLERQSAFAMRLPAVWGTQTAQFLSLARGHAGLDRERITVLQTVMAPLFCCVIGAGPALSEPWRALWDEAGRCGITKNPNLRIHLSVLGSFAGEPAQHVAAMLEPGMDSHFLSAGLCLVRNDRTDDLLDCIAACTRGDKLEPRRCLHPSRPTSTLVRLAEYIRSCMRNPRHFYNEGLVMNLLLWTAQLRRMVATHASEWPDHVERLLAEIERIEQVQILEKARFWAAHDGLSDGPARRKLAELWSTPDD